MDIDYLREFIVLAEKKNYSDAASQLFIAQSTLSRHIFSLEDKLGVKLFERSPKSVELTRFGNSLLPYAMKIAEIESEGLKKIEDERETSEKRIVIGTVNGIEAFGVMDNIAAYVANNPDIAVKTIISTEPKLKEMLKEDKVDIIIGDFSGDEESGIIRKYDIHEERLAVIVSQDSKLAEKKRIGLEELKKEFWILQDDNYIMKSAAIMLCGQMNFEPKIPQIRTEGFSTHELVRAGLGISLDTDKNAKKWAGFGLAHILINPIQKIKISMERTKNSSEAVNEFCRYYMKKYV